MKKGRKLLCSLLSVACLFAMLTGCASNTDDGKSSSDITSDTIQTSAKQGGTAKIIYGAGEDFDLTKTYVAGRFWTFGIGETLFTVNKEGEMEPLLADSYERTDDLTWKIKLKHNVKFHDGSDFNADSVIAVFENLMDKEKNINYSTYSFIDTITKESDDTVVFKTKEPYGPFLSVLGSYPTIMAFADQETKTINGTGPFKLDQIIKDVKTTVVRNDNYWGGTPNLDGAEFLAVEDEVSRLYMLYNNEADLSFLGVPAAYVPEMKTQDNLNYSSIARAQVVVLELNNKEGPLADKNIRQAISYAIDREALVANALEGIGGVPAYNVFSDELSWCNDTVHKTEYNPEKAKELLAQAGVVDTNGDGILEYEGKPFTLNLMTYDVMSFKPSVEVIQAQLKELGIQTNIEITTWEITDDKKSNGNYDINLDITVFYENADPDSLSSTFSSGSRAASLSGYHNDRVDQLLQEARNTVDESERKEKYDEIQNIVMEDMPLIPLYFDVTHMGINKRLVGYELNPYIDSRLTKDMYIAEN